MAKIIRDRELHKSDFVLDEKHESIFINFLVTFVAFIKKLREICTTFLFSDVLTCYFSVD